MTETMRPDDVDVLAEDIDAFIATNYPLQKVKPMIEHDLGFDQFDTSLVTVNPLVLVHDEDSKFSRRRGAGSVVAGVGGVVVGTLAATSFEHKGFVLSPPTGVFAVLGYMTLLATGWLHGRTGRSDHRDERAGPG